MAAQSNDPADFSVTEALALIRGRKLTPLELTQACLRRVERLNPRLNALVTLMADSATARARELRRSDAEAEALHGIPIAIKDLYDTAGVRTTAGSAHWKQRVPVADAEVVRRLRHAGAVLTGKANMDEFAFHFTSETSTFGPTQNPWKAGYIPGGSSGGSAVAVATGMSLAALGSDTGGSIRLPASLCGITGFKPTYGRVPLKGVAPLAWSADHAGPMTRSALDASLLHEVLSGKPLALGPVGNLRIGVPRDLYWEGLEPEVAEAVSSAGGILRRLCRELRDVTIPRLELNAAVPMPASLTTIIFAEAYAYHRERMVRNPSLFHDGTRASLELGKPIDAATYIAARREMERARAGVTVELFRDADLLLTPTVPLVAVPLGTDPSLVFLRNTAPWNYYGLPTISIPCGLGKGGLPVGLQLTGAPDADAIVLSAAAAFQQETEFHLKIPSP